MEVKDLTSYLAYPVVALIGYMSNRQDKSSDSICKLKETTGKHSIRLDHLDESVDKLENKLDDFLESLDKKVDNILDKLDGQR